MISQTLSLKNSGFKRSDEMTKVNLNFNILNEEIVGLDSQKFIELIEEVLLHGFSEKGIDVEIKELNRN